MIKALLVLAIAGYCSCDVKLEFVQAMWRHGERSSQIDLYPIYEADWIYGGGGLGELTAKGMGEMNELGRLIRQRYVQQQQFLKPKYASREVYIRSTDFNRTIISAMSLLYGLFPPSLYDVPNVDYPFTPFKWQPGLTFVPVHVDSPTQCAASQNCGSCPRYDALQTAMLALPEVLPAFQKVVLLNRQVGPYYNMTTGIDTFYTYPDTWKCQRAYFNSTLYAKLPWYNEELYYKSQTVYAPVKGFLEGNFVNSTVVNGLDIGHEMRVLRSGVLINELYDRANQKLNCAADPTCTNSFKQLKFYAYSIHDNNVYAALVALGIPNLANTIDGWPAYAAGLIVEFHRDTVTDERFFKVLYRQGDDAPITPVTHLVPICNGATLCPFSALQTLAATLKPLPDYTTVRVIKGFSWFFSSATLLYKDSR